MNGTHEPSSLRSQRGVLAGSLRPLQGATPHIRLDDSAVRVVSESTHDALWTIREDSRLDVALHRMFQLGVGAFLVTRARQVVGLIACDDIKRKRSTRCNATRVADVMTDAAHIPLIEWQRVLDATVSDLLEMFERSQVNHLLVVDSQVAEVGRDVARVRGLVYRRQLVRQLGVFPILNRAMEAALAPFRQSTLRQSKGDAASYCMCQP
jgi:CBS domain-containing protein